MPVAPGAEESTDDEFASLDDAVHQRTRLAILTILHEAGEADFRFLRTTLDLTDGNLGRHLEVLLRAGHITTRRGYDGRRAKNWVALTPQGTAALSIEVEALRAIVARVDRAQNP
ncbi:MULTISPECIES: transcriptional regulator [unclassified Rathayibacter]|uniref:transcriptional regulator n=1 Tax=unclassified Rathayibacter TaxID=2609250 RepID=UPI0021588BA3|nr:MULTISPECIES: transcriptional regulator [unclassified Rathayibacter]